MPSRGKGAGKRDGANDGPDVPDSGGNAVALDPEADYSGTSCRYFTCNAVRKDQSGLNYYADGSFVIYGERAYECHNRRWHLKGPAGAWLPQAKNRRAEVLEAGCTN